MKRGFDVSREPAIDNSFADARRDNGEASRRVWLGLSRFHSEVRKYFLFSIQVFFKSLDFGSALLL